MRERIQVFWQPGCTSCLRTKEFLASRGIDFESVDVANDRDGMARLQKLGARGLPVVAIGDRWVFAQSTKTVAEFVGVPLGTSDDLDQATLVKRMTTILDAALRFARQLPPSAFAQKLPKRDRTYGELSWHIFRVAEAFLEAEGGGTLTFAALAEGLPPTIRSTDDVIAYGTSVRDRILAYWERETDRAGNRLLDTFYGKHKSREVLERSTWHSGQHLRQLMMVLESLGIAPNGKLTAEDFAGLPMPVNVWDDKLQFEARPSG